MTVYRFNVAKAERKALVAAMSEITGYKPIFKGAPKFEYVVGDYSVSLNGCVTAYSAYDEEELTRMVMELVERGFKYEPDGDLAPEDIKPDDEAVNDTEPDMSDAKLNEPDTNVIVDTNETYTNDTNTSTEVHHDNIVNIISEDEDMLSIDMPLQGFSTSALSNLQRMVAAKAWIIKLMIGADALPIENVEGKLRFPWFNNNSSAKEIDAYSHLIFRLCETAKAKRRVTAEERLPGQDENVKYKGRCFLLSIGFIGSDYSQVRKMLLANLPGNGSFLQGTRKKEPVPALTPPSMTIPNVDVQNIQEAIV